MCINVSHNWNDIIKLDNLFVILGRGGFRGGRSVVVEPHRHEGKDADCEKHKHTGTSKISIRRCLSITFVENSLIEKKMDIF